MSELNKIALKIISYGKGILAADESNGTMTKRLKAVNVSSTPENRLSFRETLFSSESMKKCIGGVILYDETINQITSLGKSIPDLILSSGAIPGIKVDTGAKDLANSSDEKITEGLDGLRDRLKKYYELVQDLQNGGEFIQLVINFQVSLQLLVMLMHLQDILPWFKRVEWFQ